ncbi:hypothetical protein SAMN05421505_1673 [Sinosporangium album]|uniref:ABC-2 type transport system permease protein n=1 Tax=Sinosporangium album TaxID=504805 RepID=A0A1G8LFW3_9ACTN|nr:DUF6297 family protein [Sinosporangium album]SDI54397.1 hypothetical protein SAMN05421505_1673 [Sinosporangium album]
MNPARAYLRSKRGEPMGWTERYSLLFGVGLAVMLGGQQIVDALDGLARQVDPGRAAAGLALAAAGYVGFLALARAAGPVVLPAADAAWLVLSPLPRRSVLGRSAMALLAVSTAGGLVLGLALLSVVGAPDGLVLRLLGALVLGVGATVGGMAMAVLGQGSHSWDWWLLGLIAAGTAVAVLMAVYGEQIAARLAGAPAGWVAALAGVVAACAALLARKAWAALDRVPARGLMRSSARMGRAASAAAMMDPGMLTWAAEDNHWRGRAVRSRRWPVRGGAVATAWQEWRRLGRRPGRLVLLHAAAVLPALAARAGGGLSVFTAGVLLCGAMTAAAICTTGARRDGDNPSLARLLAGGPRRVMGARAVLPGVMAAVWLLFALGGLALVGALPGVPWWLIGPLAAPALAAAALRMAGRGPIDHSLPVLDTPGGPVPLGVVMWAAKGVDLAVVGCAPLLVLLLFPSADPVPVLLAQAVAGLGVLAVFVLRSAGRRARVRLT